MSTRSSRGNFRAGSTGPMRSSGAPQPEEPRQVGDLCYSGYWQVPYLVIEVSTVDRVPHLTVLNLCEPNESWKLGTINTKSHCTAWDWRRDQFIAHDMYFDGQYWAHIEELREKAVTWVNPKTGRTRN